MTAIQSQPLTQAPDPLPRCPAPYAMKALVLVVDERGEQELNVRPQPVAKIPALLRPQPEAPDA